MQDRVLDERLQDEGRDQLFHRPRVRLQVKAKPLLQAQALDLQIAAYERPFVGQGHLVERLPVHSQAVVQDLAETLQRPLCERRITAHQAESRMERVEEEVGIELAAEHGQLGAGAQRVGLGRARRLLPHALGVLPGVGPARDREIDEPAHHRLPGDDHRIEAKLGAARGQERIEGPGRDDARGPDQRIRHRQPEVSREEPGPPLVVPGHPPRKPKHQQSQERKREDGDESGPDRGRRRSARGHEERRVHRGQRNPGDRVRPQRRIAKHRANATP